MAEADSPALKFFVGLHHEADARYFDRACISINRLRNRRSPFLVKEWILDCAGFTEVSTYGRYRHSVAEYARDAKRLASIGRLVAVVSQDYMCEPFILRRTGMTVAEHQRLTVERYDALASHDVGAPILPTLQGFEPDEYRRHLELYGDRLGPGQWVGVGSVCKRNGNPAAVAGVLWAIKSMRPDLRLHGFGLKITALLHAGVRSMLYSADSLAWSMTERHAGRSAHDWRAAKAYEKRVTGIAGLNPVPWQIPFIFQAGRSAP
jgi:hypothetical protein